MWTECAQITNAAVLMALSLSASRIVCLPYECVCVCVHRAHYILDGAEIIRTFPTSNTHSVFEACIIIVTYFVASCRTIPCVRSFFPLYALQCCIYAHCIYLFSELLQCRTKSTKPPKHLHFAVYSIFFLSPLTSIFICRSLLLHLLMNLEVVLPLWFTSASYFQLSTAHNR